MLQVLKKSKPIVGTKQLLKAVAAGEVSLVFVARDADAFVTRRLVELCQEKGVEVQWTETMRELGLACQIDVGAAAAGIRADSHTV